MDAMVEKSVIFQENLLNSKFSGSSDSTVKEVWAEKPRFGSQKKQDNIFLGYRVQAVSGAHQAFQFWRSFPEVGWKVRQATTHLTVWCPGEEREELSSILVFIFMACHVQIYVSLLQFEG
jgi:hypothetical protein